MIERFHRTLKSAIMARGGKDWINILSIVLLGLRTAWKEDLYCSLADLVFGEPLREPEEFCMNSSRLISVLAQLPDILGPKHLYIKTLIEVHMYFFDRTYYAVL